MLKGKATPDCMIVKTRPAYKIKRGAFIKKSISAESEQYIPSNFTFHCFFFFFSDKKNCSTPIHISIPPKARKNMLWPCANELFRLSTRL